MIASAVGRRRDQEHQVGGTVLGAEVDTGLRPPERQRRLADVRGSGVRDPDPALEAGRHLFLARGDVREESVEIAHASRIEEPLCE